MTASAMLDAASSGFQRVDLFISTQVVPAECAGHSLLECGHQLVPFPGPRVVHVPRHVDVHVEVVGRVSMNMKSVRR